MATVADVPALAARTHAEHNLAYALPLGGRVLSTDEVEAVDVASPAPFLNCLLPLRPADPAATAVAARAFFGGTPHVVVDYFAALDLTPYGYTRGLAMPVMVRDPAPVAVNAPGLAVERVRDAAALAAFERIVVEGMGIDVYADRPAHSLWPLGALDRPALRLHLGRAGGRPVTCAAAVVLDDCVGVFAVATLPGDRRRGYGAAVTAAALADAPPLPAVLTASPPGEGVYTALGFVTVGMRTGWRST